MYRRQAIPYVSQFFILVGLVAGGLLVSLFVGAMIWLAMAGGALDLKSMLDPANANAVKLVQLVSSAIMFLVPTLIFAKIVNPQPLKHLGMRTKFNWAQAGLAILIIFVAFYFSGALGELTNHIPISDKLEKKFKALEKQYVDQVMVMANMKTVGDYLYTLLVIAVAPAIFEELLFRGALQQIMVRWTRVAWVGILITSILFSAVHFSFYGFLARVGLGMILGYMFYYSKSIWLPVIAHFINNGFAVTMMYYMNKQGKLSTKALDERFPIWYGVIALGIIIALLIAYRNQSKKLGTYYLDNTAVKSNNPFEDDFDFERRQV